MLIVMTKAALDEATGAVGGVVPAQTPRPAYKCALIEAKDGVATISASNGEVWASAPIPGVEVRGDGAALVPFAELKQIAKAARADLGIEMESDGSHATIVSGRSRWRLALMPAEHFITPRPVGEPTLFVAAADYLKAVSRVAHAADQQPTSRNIGGVAHLDDDGSLVLVAYNGAKLASQTVPVASGSPPERERGLMVPRRAVETVANVIRSGSEQDALGVAFGTSMVEFRIGGATIHAMLAEGTFLGGKNFAVPFKAPSSLSVTVAAGVARSSFEAASVTKNKETHAIRVEADADLILRCRGETGESEVACDVLSGLPAAREEFLIDPRNVADVLKPLGDDNPVTVEAKVVTDSRTGERYVAQVAVVTEDGFRGVMPTMKIAAVEPVAA